MTSSGPGSISAADEPLSRIAGEGAELSEAGEGSRPMTPIGNARRLRREATDAEGRLWSALRDRRLAGYRFRRQHPIGGFVVDFACTRYRLVIEADGSQHADDPADATRTALFQQRGWRVLRFWNNDILLRTDAVIESILSALQQEALTRSRSASATTHTRGAGEGLRGTG